MKKDAQSLAESMGKKKFAEMVVNSPKNGDPAYVKRDRPYWGKGKVLAKICPHGKMTVRDGIPYEKCPSCGSETPITKLRDFQPGFNIGLGHYVESRSEEKRIAKSLGLTEAG